MGAKVFGGPKYTVTPIYEGMLKEEMDAAAARHPDVPYEPQLIDATFALLISSSGAPMVIPALNRDGDILSDLVLPLFGSIAGSESLLVAFGDEIDLPDRADGGGRARHGARAGGQGRREPDGDDPRVGRAPRHSDDEECADRRSRDPRGDARGRRGGHPHRGPRRPPRHDAFTDEVIRRTRTKLEVWASL